MKIAIGSDHRGFKKKLKIIKYLNKKGHEVTDYGTTSDESVDYPHYAKLVTESIINNENQMGILICGTGIGMSIAANRYKGIRCAHLNNVKDAKLSRLHNNANVVALGSGLRTFDIKDILDIFIKTSFSSDERHIKRNEMIDL